MKYLLFIFLTFVIGCEKEHECKTCEKVFVDLLTNEVIRTEPFEACDEALREIENKSIVATNAEGNTTIGVIICNK
jgi:hypothetical protein